MEYLIDDHDRREMENPGFTEIDTKFFSAFVSENKFETIGYYLRLRSDFLEAGCESIKANVSTSGYDFLKQIGVITEIEKIGNFALIFVRHFATSKAYQEWSQKVRTIRRAK